MNAPCIYWLILSTHLINSSIQPTYQPCAGKAAPPPAKGKKGSVADLSVVEHKVEEKPLTANPDRMCLACVKTAANTLIAVCQRHGTAMTVAVVEELALHFSKIMLNKATWEMAQAGVCVNILILSTYLSIYLSTHLLALIPTHL